jgi:hypothetical protein
VNDDEMEAQMEYWKGKAEAAEADNARCEEALLWFYNKWKDAEARVAELENAVQEDS